jgi:mRNA interferase MazF
LAGPRGQIVIADRAETLPKEPNGVRSAAVVEDETLFDPAYPNVILVPLTKDRRLAIPDLSLAMLAIQRQIALAIGLG